MCGRYSITSAPEALRRLFRYQEEPDFPPRYNVAPTQPIAIVRLFEGQRQFRLVRWGLIPSWVKDPREFSLLINARGETIAEKPAFRAAMRYRRCLIPADGFYEWKRDGERKRPYYAYAKSGAPLAFAGLWEAWSGPNGEELETAAIVTTAANRMLLPIHDRMPVIIPEDAFDLWLDCVDVDAEQAAALIVPAPDELLEVREVSNAVNRTANDSPALIAPVKRTADADAPPPVARPRKRASAGSDDGGQGSLF